MKHEMTRQLFDYWSTLRGNRKAPMRLELDPSAIAPILGNSFVLERTNPVSFNYRLAGTRICSFHSRELRGKSFIEQWNPSDHESLTAILRTVTEDAAGAVVGYNARARRDLAVPFEMVLLPLARDNGEFDRVIGLETPLASAYWVGVMPIISLEVKSVRYLWPDGVPVEPVQDIKRALPEAPVPKVSNSPRAMLKVIRGGRE